jgi:hypothetical protein
MFTLSNKLLSGVTVVTSPKFSPKLSSKSEDDLPVWVILMKGEIEISYRVSWRTGG